MIIRDIRSLAEVRAVEDLQKEVWGIPDLEVVPLSQLIAARESGGVLLGAFDGTEMVGFAYGFVGHERGVMTHHSHMLAVKPEYRSHGVGFQLKTEQRKRVLAQDIGIMTWTFDPLQSLNAFFNFRKLGVVADRYFVDFYGSDAASFLHQNGTDRFWVSWHLATERVKKRISNGNDEPSCPAETALTVVEGDRPLATEVDLSVERFAVEIPRRIDLIEAENSDLAREWRIATRGALTRAMDAGFIVEDFCVRRRGEREVGVYILSRTQGLMSW